MNEGVEKDGWNEWSKRIINDLERFDKQLDLLRADVNKVNLDIAKLGYLNSSLSEIENKLTRIREDIISRNSDYKDAIDSLERDDANNMKQIEADLTAINIRIAEFEVFMTRTKTIAWVIGTVLAALVGMFSFSLKDLFK